MLAIRKPDDTTPRVVANVLPCRIQHNGPVHATTRHWNVEVDDDKEDVKVEGRENVMKGEKDEKMEEVDAEAKKTSTTYTSYFRGRKLCGRSIRIPEGYKGLVLEKTNTVLQQPQSQQVYPQDEDTDPLQQEHQQEIKLLNQIATFDEIMVWGHEALPEESQDGFARGVREWIGFAGAMHSYED